jgi:hypothetical protein
MLVTSTVSEPHDLLAAATDVATVAFSRGEALGP